MRTSEALRRAQEMITDEADWCRHTTQNSQGQHCALGAVCMVHWGIARFPNNAVLRALPSWTTLNEEALRLFGMSPIRVNNHLGHAAIMEVFAAAIERAIEEELAEEQEPFRIQGAPVPAMVGG